MWISFRITVGGATPPASNQQRGQPASSDGNDPPFATVYASVLVERFHQGASH